MGGWDWRSSTKSCKHACCMEKEEEQEDEEEKITTFYNLLQPPPYIPYFFLSSHFPFQPSHPPLLGYSNTSKLFNVMALGCSIGPATSMRTHRTSSNITSPNFFRSSHSPFQLLLLPPSSFVDTTAPRTVQLDSIGTKCIVGYEYLDVSFHNQYLHHSEGRGVGEGLSKEGE